MTNLITMVNFTLAPISATTGLSQKSEWYRPKYRKHFVRLKSNEDAQMKTKDEKLKPVIKVTVAHLKPFAYYTQNGLVGIDIDIWRTIAKALKIKLRLIFLGGDMGGTRRLVSIFYFSLHHTMLLSCLY